MTSHISRLLHAEPYYTTNLGAAYLGNALDLLKEIPSDSINLIVTSPPFALQTKKKYGNVDHSQYVQWFLAFGEEFHRVLAEDGSLVVDIGGSFCKGLPVRSLYHFELLLQLCRQCNFHLAQEFYWWNPSRLPSPAEWVTVRRMRVKDAVDPVWWLSKSPYPKADNRRILVPYSRSMQELLRKDVRSCRRPSGHVVSSAISRDNGGAIPPNLLAIPNTESNSGYLRKCRSTGVTPHPARFPEALPEFFIKFLTTEGDRVLDPFGGSNVTGSVCQSLQRRWLTFEIREDYLSGSMLRFHPNDLAGTADREQNVE